MVIAKKRVQNAISDFGNRDARNDFKILTAKSFALSGGQAFAILESDFPCEDFVLVRKSVNPLHGNLLCGFHRILRPAHAGQAIYTSQFNRPVGCARSLRIEDIDIKERVRVLPEQLYHPSIQGHGSVAVVLGIKRMMR